MKLLTSLLVITFSVQINAADTKILDFKDWSASEIESHNVSEKGACVASTSVKGEDTRIEVYAEASPAGGYVQPVVQIVTTNMGPALGVMAKVDNTPMPMTIALKETKEVEIEVLEEGSSIPVVKKVEQQVFLGKFKDKETMIRLLRQKNKVTAKFFAATGEVDSATFSLRGSSKTISSMMETCFE